MALFFFSLSRTRVCVCLAERQSSSFFISRVIHEDLLITTGGPQWWWWLWLLLFLLSQTSDNGNNDTSCFFLLLDRHIIRSITMTLTIDFEKVNNRPRTSLFEVELNGRQIYLCRYFVWWVVRNRETSKSMITIRCCYVSKKHETYVRHH